jgi:hypothetical protein
VLGGHQEAIAEMGSAAGKAVNGHLLGQREISRDKGLEPLGGFLEDLQAEAHHLLELNLLSVGVVPLLGLQFRKGNETPGQIIAIKGPGVEAKQRLRPLAQILQVTDAPVARERLGRGHARL